MSGVVILPQQPLRMELLAAVAGRVTMPGAVAKDSAPRLPLSACVLLRRWSREAPRSLEEAQAQLRVLQRANACPAGAAPFRLRWRQRRFYSSDYLRSPCCRNASSRPDPEHREVIGLLTVLRTDVPLDRPVQSPEYRRALETYLAGQHGALLRNTSFGAARQWQDRRPARTAPPGFRHCDKVSLGDSGRTGSKQGDHPTTLDRVRPPQSLGVASAGVIVAELNGGDGKLAGPVPAASCPPSLFPEAWPPA